MIKNFMYNSTFKLLKHLRNHRPELWKQNRKYFHENNRNNVHLTTPLFLKGEHEHKKAVVDKYGSHSYGKIFSNAIKLTGKIREKLGVNQDVNKERICFLCGNDVSYVVTKWAIWISGGIAVPLCTSHPASQLQYFIEDSQSNLLVFAEEYKEVVEELLCNTNTLSLMLPKSVYTQNGSEEAVSGKDSQMLSKQKYYSKEREALIIYTSGTTGKPKGVVHTFGSLYAQMQAMIEAWKWSGNDVVLHVLPLHHIHGIVNMLMTPLYVGATCVMLPKFDAKKVWELLLSPGNFRLSVNSIVHQRINVFMAVPTIYKKLLDFLDEQKRDFEPFSNNLIKATCSAEIRLMVSGSAALPEPIMLKWQEVTGHLLLERYGMTEIGMALTNPLDGERIPGAVGKPFPSVDVCIGRRNVSSTSGYDVLAIGNHEKSTITKGEEEEQGELLVKGPSLFKEYWNKPAETKDSFSSDGWFRTGDTACYLEGNYYIKGRTSVDIIKSGGYKISALEIERHLISHPDIFDVAVVGIPDITWGQKIAVVATLNKNKSLTLGELKAYCSDKLPHYQIPSVLKVLNSIPRNQMGKVNKKELLSDVFSAK